ncbi:Splicing factor, arginine serine-rich [Halocaridina rubra]|uniref:Splicing factor, arginine serine-rich n=1 Tax=Halocaridina rubra TaxID=373956 RepID=A0AAN9AB22_HALRR
MTHTDVIDMDLDSPNSPDSSDVSDIFEPPSPHSTHQSEKPSPKKLKSQTKSTPVKSSKSGPVDKFDSLFGSGAARPTSRKHSTPHKHNKHGKSKGKQPVKKDGNEEDIPNSAVDLQVKEKFLKKVQRQERVVEEVKLSLKPFYNKKTISKDDYKEIMRKCVQKVCHNKSGEINPTKIRGLVQGYIRKVKYYKKKQNGPGDQLPVKPTPTDPLPPGFAMIQKVTKPPTPIKSKA